MTFRGMCHHKPELFLTGTYAQTHTQLLKRKWLTSRLILNFVCPFFLFFNFISSYFRQTCSMWVSLYTSLCSCVCAPQPFPHHLTRLWFSATHPLLLCFLLPPRVTHLLRFLVVFFSSGDGDWQMIWHWKTSGEEKLTSPSNPPANSLPIHPRLLLSSSSCLNDLNGFLYLKFVTSLSQFSFSQLCGFTECWWCMLLSPSTSLKSQLAYKEKYLYKIK